MLDGKYAAPYGNFTIPIDYSVIINAEMKTRKFIEDQVGTLEWGSCMVLLSGMPWSVLLSIPLLSITFFGDDPVLFGDDIFGVESLG